MEEFLKSAIRWSKSNFRKPAKRKHMYKDMPYRRKADLEGKIMASALGTMNWSYSWDTQVLLLPTIQLDM